MIGGGFLGEEDRGKLVALARDGMAASRVTRRANRLCCWTTDGAVGTSPLRCFSTTTLCNWRKLFEQRGIEGLTSFDMGGSAAC